MVSLQLPRIFAIMIDLSQDVHQIQCVTNFQDLVSTPFHGAINALCWTRQLIGDFAEIVEKVALDENITVLDEDALLELPINLGLGHLWRLAIDYPESKVLPCVHRAPKEKTKRLLLIC